MLTCPQCQQQSLRGSPVEAVYRCCVCSCVVGIAELLHLHAEIIERWLKAVPPISVHKEQWRDPRKPRAVKRKEPEFSED